MKIQEYGERSLISRLSRSLGTIFQKREGYVTMVERISLDGLDTHEEEM